MSGARYLEACRKRLDSRLAEMLGSSRSEYDASPDALATLFDACSYALGVGGKRVRPALVYAAAEAVGGNAQDPELDFIAASVEFIHTYSLVHDDLPAMDDDDLRRGHPTVHCKYDEATAVLVGDAFQARALELLTLAPGVSDTNRVRMLAQLTAAAGPRGMVGGQAVDTSAVQRRISLGQLQGMHNLKTGALIRASVTLGGIWAGAPEQHLASLDRYAQNIGLAFQVKDDLLDIEGDAITLGKTSGKDARNGKPTYVSLLGVNPAKDKLRCLLESAMDALKKMGDEADPLRELARYIVDRDH